MPTICYLPKTFRGETLNTIATAKAICEEYAAQGITITLRQLYYQFVARGYIPNRDTEYKRLGQIVNDARLAGLIDWNHLQDRTRNLISLSHWDRPADIIQSAAYSFRLDKWDRKYQVVRPFVWIEKDAQIGNVESVCVELDVPFFSCRGYTSQSEMWAQAQRFARIIRAGQDVALFHFGDHDPSGIDMSRDIQERLALFGVSARHFRFERVALNMDQVEEHNPPPNPAKLTDARAQGYIEQFGNESWELDALDPTLVASLIREKITALRSDFGWEKATAEEQRHKQLLETASDHWYSLVDYMTDNLLGIQPEDGN